MPITVMTTGGTIDKIYFDAKDRYEIGASQVGHILEEGRVEVDYEVVSLMQKDSLDIDDDDRATMLAAVRACANDWILITHGTDTMTDTAAVLGDVTNKTIVLTGALSPARFRATDAIFNVGMAVAAVQVLPPGVYIAMNGQIFPAGAVRKNREHNRFERLD